MKAENCVSDLTTLRLDSLLEKHESMIQEQIKMHGLPLHVFFVEEMTYQVEGFFEIKKKLYKNLKIAFAIKSNPCRGAIRAASKLGMGADSASEYELQAALEEQIPPESITCNGNAKSNRYLELAVQSGAFIVVDNKDEWAALEQVCEKLKAKANILIRFRGMPLSGLTADDQSTAADWTKFGFHIDEAESLFGLVQKSSSLNYKGISAHIGTQLSGPAGFMKLFENFFDIVELAKSFSLTTEEINIGGGFPVAFIDRNNASEFQNRLYRNVSEGDKVDSALTWNGLAYGFEHVRHDANSEKTWKGKTYWTDYPGSRMLEYVLTHPMPNGKTPLEQLQAIGSPKLIVEPGRSVTAPSGITMCEVMGTKQVMDHTVVTLDLGINNHSTNLIAPDIFPAAVLPYRPDDRPVEAFLAGRLCFSGDMVSKNKVRLNRHPDRGESFVIFHTGGYSADHFASHSCGFPRPAKIAILENGAVELWRARENFTDVFGCADTTLSL